MVKDALASACILHESHHHVGVQALASNKAQLIMALAPWEDALQQAEFLAGNKLSLADVAAMADLRLAFEKARRPYNMWPPIF